MCDYTQSENWIINIPKFAADPLDSPPECQEILRLHSREPLSDNKTTQK